MEMSSEINEIALALSKAQGMIEGAKKSSANPFFKSKYADLAEVWDACREPLASNGLSVVQSPSVKEGYVSISTLLMHESGQWIKDQLEMKLLDDKPQTVGSLITYGRRYSLSAMVGVSPEDDDGNMANGNGQARQHQVTPPVPKITGAQLAELTTMVASSKSTVEAFSAHLKVPSLSQLPAASFEFAKKKLQVKIDQIKEVK